MHRTFISVVMPRIVQAKRSRVQQRMRTARRTQTLARAPKMTAVPLIVNGETVPDHTLERELLLLSSGLEMAAPHARGFEPALLRSQAMRNVVGRTLLLQAAVSHNLRVSASEVEAERRRQWGSTSNSVCGTGVDQAIAQDILLARVQVHLVRHVPRPSRGAVEEQYHRDQQRYFQPEAVEAAHIFQACTQPEASAAAKKCCW